MFCIDFVAHTKYALSPFTLKINKFFDSSLFGQFIEFDQTEFFGLVRGYMDTTGYIYVPSNCQDKTNQCRLHIALHGCRQGRLAFDFLEN